MKSAGVRRRGVTIYLRDCQMRKKASRSVKRIAIIGVPVLSHGSHPDKSALAQCFSRRKDWRLIFMSEAYLDAFRLLEQIPCDGVLARVITPEIAAVARRLSFPVVNLSTLLENPGVPTVRSEPRDKGRLCARHLMEKGFTRIGMVALPFGDWCFKEMEAGFLDELKREAPPGLAISRYLVKSPVPDKQELKRFGQWLRGMKPPFALFLNDDEFAPELMDACRKTGFSIPQQVAVIASSGHPDIIPECHPSLTHTTDDFETIMETACDHLAELIRRPRQRVRTISLSCARLVTGDSTDIFAVDDPMVARAVEFMDANFRTGINVADTVRALGCARRLLERRFFSEMGKTIHEYLMGLRIQAAMNALTAAPGTKLTSLAKECGFGERQAFRKAFEAATGQAPSAWRRAIEAKAAKAI